MVDVVKTEADLVNRAAVKLGAKTGSDELAQEDYDTIVAYLPELIDELSLGGVVDIADTSQIPSQYFPALAMLLANEAAGDFGGVTDPGIRAAGEARLRRVSSSPTTGPVRVTYF